MMNISINSVKENGKTVVSVSGEIDVYTAPQLKEKLTPLVDIEGNEVLVDFAEVNYMDSTGLGILVGAFKRSKERNGQIKLINLQERIYRLFTITGLDDLFDISPVVKGGTE